MPTKPQSPEAMQRIATLLLDSACSQSQCTSPVGRAATVVVDTAPSSSTRSLVGEGDLVMLSKMMTVDVDEHEELQRCQEQHQRAEAKREVVAVNV